MLGVVFKSAGTDMAYGILLLLVYALGHCSLIVLAGAFTSVVQRYLNWAERRPAAPTRSSGVCGVLVIAAGTLSHLQGMTGRTMGKLKILFLCTGNSCRSQMAEGWARHLKGDVLEPYSAGVEVHGLNPSAVRVMAEAGVDISNHRSKHVRELADIAFDYVVTVCDRAHESCPFFPGATRDRPQGIRRSAAPRQRRQDRGGGAGPLPPRARRHTAIRGRMARPSESSCDKRRNATEDSTRRNLVCPTVRAGPSP